MSQCMSDQHRMYFKKQLSKHQIDLDSPDHKKFCNYISNPINGQHLQVFILLCSGLLEPKIIDIKLDEIIGDFRFHLQNGYTYRHVFSKDTEWYDFFKENAFPCGQRRPAERRRGVSREYVDEIDKISKKLILPIEQAISIWSSLKHKKFCIDNTINPYYGNR